MFILWQTSIGCLSIQTKIMPCKNANSRYKALCMPVSINGGKFATRLRDTCSDLVITVARDSGRLLYFGRVIYLFYFFFRPPNFRHPWADFRETLPHDTVCAEIVYLLYGCSYVPPNKFEGRKTPLFGDFRTQNRDLEPSHSLLRGKSGNLKQ